jgi:FtsZ-interacting cell division protein ZipA
METLVTILIVVGAIALGALILHMLNAQHAERIANHYYTPSRRRRNGGKSGQPESKGPLPDKK